MAGDMQAVYNGPEDLVVRSDVWIETVNQH